MTIDIISFCDDEKQVVQTNEDITVVGTIENGCEAVQVTNSENVATIDTQTDVITIGVQGPPGSSSGVAVWTYVQEATPIGGEGYTWFQPSTGYGHVWIAGLVAWMRFLTENMTSDGNDHGISANGGYF